MCKYPSEFLPNDLTIKANLEMELPPQYTSNGMVLPPSANHNLKKQRAEGLLNPITEEFVYDFGEKSWPRVEKHATYH